MGRTIGEWSIEEQLDYAKGLADCGFLTGMSCFLRIADSSAQKTGQDISEQKEEIMVKGYSVAYQQELNISRNLAIQGKVSAMEHTLVHAETNAQTIGQDISEQVAEIRAIVPELDILEEYNLNKFLK